jgi:hypothetical protein
MPASMSVEYPCRLSGALNERVYTNGVSAGYTEFAKGNNAPLVW